MGDDPSLAQQMHSQKSGDQWEERGHPITQRTKGEWQRKACFCLKDFDNQSSAWTEMLRINGYSSLTLKITLFTLHDSDRSEDQGGSCEKLGRSSRQPAQS